MRTHLDDDFDDESDDFFDRDPGPDDDDEVGHTRRRGCPKCSRNISRCSCELDGEDPIDGVGFADPGGESALRAETCFNPRDRPCPSCHRPNALTRIDVGKGYQCDRCADAAERGDDSGYYDCGGAEGGCIICKENDEEETT
jgi:hypothetical protein